MNEILIIGVFGAGLLLIRRFLSWSADDAMPRAFGFLSDVNHYGGYLVGVILLALAYLIYNRRDKLAYCALIAGTACVQ